jgi:hypothetical protein
VDGFLDIQDHALHLVEQALDDFDQPTFRLSSVIRKAIRIAVLLNDQFNRFWLEYEIINFENKLNRDILLTDIAQHYSEDNFKKLKRWVIEAYLSERKATLLNADLTPIGDDKVCTLGVSTIEEEVDRLRLDATSAVPPTGLHPIDLYHMEKEYENVRTFCRVNIREYLKILANIQYRVHSFLSSTAKRLMYGKIHSDIYEKNRVYVDTKLRTLSPETFAQFISAYKRLTEGDNESRAQALVSCRRILKSVADVLYPSTDDEVSGPDGKARKLTDDKYISRLWQFVYEKKRGTASANLLQAQISELGQRIERVYELSSKGVHADVSDFEVNQCVIQTYLTVGDVLHLAD